MSDTYNALTTNLIMDLMGLTLYNLDHSLRFGDCKIESSLTTLLWLLGKTYPSEVLSLLLNRTVGAVFLGDTLGLLQCKSKKWKFYLI